MSKRSKEFKKDLGALLKKYDAEISFNVGDCADTYGLYDEHITVDFQGLTKGARFKTTVESITLADGWAVDYTDL